ncbi:hypothetical protein MSG28_013246 [Choristoneura fumiferana]|uniref:Uncharacterized protein n=1 Tax=Choristoneura fumiferana TaxID=7141 RepID=A0ACC0KSF4_CHOFU|nr:hypothetical protein MSG28_013246 [Choristoneura fumiferana]
MFLEPRGVPGETGLAEPPVSTGCVMASGIRTFICFAAVALLRTATCRDEDKIIKACYWPNEVYEPCFGGCAEVSCDNPRNHLRPCYPYCEPGCVCEEPYVRDDRTHQCVMPQDCSPTQMGIPVPSKRSAKPPAPKYNNRAPPRMHGKRDEGLSELKDLRESETMPNEEFKRPSEISRMGNYFNIVIAPPPIKALQPRKILQNDGYRTPAKRMSA